MRGDASPTEVWSVYLLLCRDGSMYVGMSRDVTARFRKHQRGTGGQYTRRRGVERLLGELPIGSRVDTARLERWLKRLPRDKKIAFFVGH